MSRKCTKISIPLIINYYKDHRFFHEKGEYKFFRKKQGRVETVSNGKERFRMDSGRFISLQLAFLKASVLRQAWHPIGLRATRQTSGRYSGRYEDLWRGGRAARRTRCRGLTQSARRCDRRLCTYGVTVYKRAPYKPRRVCMAHV